MTRLEKELAALATMSPAQLAERWTLVSDGSAPTVPAPLLRRLLAQRLQEKRHGRLPLLVARELERIAGSCGAVAPEPARKPIITSSISFGSDTSNVSCRVPPLGAASVSDGRTFAFGVRFRVGARQFARGGLPETQVI